MWGSFLSTTCSTVAKLCSTLKGPQCRMFLWGKSPGIHYTHPYRKQTLEKQHSLTSKADKARQEQQGGEKEKMRRRTEVI